MLPTASHSPSEDGNSHRRRDGASATASCDCLIIQNELNTRNRAKPVKSPLLTFSGRLPPLRHRGRRWRVASTLLWHVPETLNTKRARQIDKNSLNVESSKRERARACIVFGARNTHIRRSLHAYSENGFSRLAHWDHNFLFLFFHHIVLHRRFYHLHAI